MLNRIMSRRRSSIDILHDILKLCDNGGIRKTAIMYRGNLSYDQLRRYLAVLTRQEIVAKNDLGNYQITAKGQHTLRRVSTVVELLKDLKAELSPVAEDEKVPQARNGHREEHAVALKSQVGHDSD